MMDLFGSAPVTNMPAANDGSNNLGDLFGGANSILQPQNQNPSQPV